MRMRIRVRFNGINGLLLFKGRPSGFQLRFPGININDVDNNWGTGLYPAIYRIDFDPDDSSSVLLYASYWNPSQTDDWLKDQKGYLVYGAGLNPYCNIVDEKDIPIPAFGPMEIPRPKPLECSNSK